MDLSYRQIKSIRQRIEEIFDDAYWEFYFDGRIIFKLIYPMHPGAETIAAQLEETIGVHSGNLILLYYCKIPKIVIEMLDRNKFPARAFSGHPAFENEIRQLTERYLPAIKEAVMVWQ